MSRVPNVVIVDDHPAEQALLRYFLSLRGVPSSALSPRAGAEALAALGPDVVLVDAAERIRGMPTLAQELRQRVPGASVVLLAGPGAEAPESGEAILRRPVDVAQLERIVGPILEREANSPARKRVLVIDDDPDVLAVISKVLGKAGCAVTCMRDPHEVLRQRPALAFDLVLIDIVMPGVDGLDLCWVLRQHYGEELRICMMTAASEPDHVKLASDRGADGYLTKPLRAAEVLALVGVTQLPVAEVEVAAATDRVLEPADAKDILEAGRKTPHVLVVDDDKDILEYCRAVFAGAGAVVDAIQDPSGLRDALPPGGSYDLVLLDIFMPSVDGIELLRRFCSDVRNITSRFYVITAQDDETLRVLAQRNGADGFLTKPLRPQKLLELLAS